MQPGQWLLLWKYCYSVSSSERGAESRAQCGHLTQSVSKAAWVTASVSSAVTRAHRPEEVSAMLGDSGAKPSLTL